jgi:hypothetical protein
MQHATLFPPGQVFLLRPSRKNQRGVVCEPELFEVRARAGPVCVECRLNRVAQVTGAVEHVFKQIKFGSGIFSDHMPHSASKCVPSEELSPRRQLTGGRTDTLPRMSKW